MIEAVDSVGNNQPLELFMPQKTAAGLTEYKGLEIMKYQLVLCNLFHFIFDVRPSLKSDLQIWPLVSEHTCSPFTHSHSADCHFMRAHST